MGRRTHVSDLEEQHNSLYTIPALEVNILAVTLGYRQVYFLTHLGSKLGLLGEQYILPSLAPSHTLETSLNSVVK